MAVQKAGQNTPKGTPPQPTRRSTKRKSLTWWREHEVRVKERAARREAAEEARLKTQAQIARDKAHAEAEAKRKAARR